jgi:hypothetical protein
MIRHDDPGQGIYLTGIVKASEFTNQQSGSDEVCEQWVAIAGGRGNTIYLLRKGVTAAAQCIVGHGDLLVAIWGG